MTAQAGPPFKLSSLTFSVYLPTFFFSIGQGAVIPIIPLFARELGSSVAAAALIVALRGLGQVVFDMPAGVAVSKWGDKAAMVTGTALIAVVALGASFSNSPVMLAGFVFIMGGGWAFWQLARLAYVSETVPVENHGRALSMTGGMNRIGNFIGPVIGGFLAEFYGYEAAFWAQAVAGIAAATTMFFIVGESTRAVHLEGQSIGVRLLGTVVTHRETYLRAGPPVIALGLLRQARQVFLPLWGKEELMLSESQIGLIVGASFFIDAAIFYPVGMVMDSYGRKWALVPCLLTMAVGLILLPLTTDFWSFLAIGALTGLGNGFGSGINMTLAADFSPAIGRGEFLGVWRLVSDVGQAGGPIVISGLTGLGSLTLAAVVSGGIGIAGALLVVLFVPESLRMHREVVVTPARASPQVPAGAPPARDGG
jgi:MFS family permease